FIELDESDLDDLFDEADLGGAGIDDFWEDVTTEHSLPDADGLSLDEAREQGLFPTDLDLNDFPK
ncbi:MAG: hypothetical protein IAF02_23460, partial [Anaerolineae bacterium]|nr:hypothetical protein [Anaerolineae bacterium]